MKPAAPHREPPGGNRRSRPAAGFPDETSLGGARPPSLPRLATTRPGDTGRNRRADYLHRYFDPTARAIDGLENSFLIYPWRVLCLPWLHPTKDPEANQP